MKRIYIVIISLCVLTQAIPAQVSYQRSDSLFVVKALRSEATTTLDFARLLLDRPYVAHTLEPYDKERVIVNTRQLDCTTLVETVAALTLCRQKEKRQFSDYVSILQQLRYRQGKLHGYTSRLHYFSDWIDDNTALGLVHEIQDPNPPFTATQKLNINFMSTHPKSYRLLKKYPRLIPEIKRQEMQLTGRCYKYIPKAIVNDSESLRKAIADGDIIAITCSKPGLDIAHLGFALWQEDGLHLLNASMLHKKVVIEPMTLYDYLQKHPSHTGIRIIRINKQ